MIKVLYINNDGAGFADYIEIEPETTMQAFVGWQMSGPATDYLIRVNRQPVASDYVLQEGDRISISPTKVDGAGPTLEEGRRFRTAA